MHNEKLPTKAPDPWDEIEELQKRMEKTKDADPKDVQRLRELAVSTPGVLSSAASITQSVRHQLIEKISYGVTRAIMLAEGDKLKEELGYSTASPLERQIIDHILTVRLRLIHVENAYNRQVVNQSLTLQQGAYWDALLTSNQARFLRAIETLARVRRLARNTPALQINIAGDGGKQVNVQGETQSVGLSKGPSAGQ